MAAIGIREGLRATLHWFTRRGCHIPRTLRFARSHDRNVPPRNIAQSRPLGAKCKEETRPRSALAFLVLAVQTEPEVAPPLPLTLQTPAPSSRSRSAGTGNGASAYAMMLPVVGGFDAFPGSGRAATGKLSP